MILARPIRSWALYTVEDRCRTSMQIQAIGSNDTCLLFCLYVFSSLIQFFKIFLLLPARILDQIGISLNFGLWDWEKVKALSEYTVFETCALEESDICVGGASFNIHPIKWSRVSLLRDFPATCIEIAKVFHSHFNTYFYPYLFTHFTLTKRPCHCGHSSIFSDLIHIFVDIRVGFFYFIKRFILI